MTFAVVYDLAGLKVFSRAGSPAQAQALAEQKRLDGAQSVFVYDDAWQLLTAPILAAMVRQVGGALSSEAVRPVNDPALESIEERSTQTFKIGGTRETEGANAARRENKGRIRVFRAGSPAKT